MNQLRNQWIILSAESANRRQKFDLSFRSNTLCVRTFRRHVDSIMVIY